MKKIKVIEKKFLQVKKNVIVCYNIDKIISQMKN